MRLELGLRFSLSPLCLRSLTLLLSPSLFLSLFLPGPLLLFLLLLFLFSCSRRLLLFFLLAILVLLTLLLPVG